MFRDFTYHLILGDEVTAHTVRAETLDDVLRTVTRTRASQSGFYSLTVYDPLYYKDEAAAEILSEHAIRTRQAQHGVISILDDYSRQPVKHWQPNKPSLPGTIVINDNYRRMEDKFFSEA